MPHTSVVVVKTPVLSADLIGRILEPQEIPAMPAPLLPMAAAIPATCVPWPLSSSVEPPGTTQFVPGKSLPANTGRVLDTPESTTAITELAFPVVVSLAAGTLTRCGPH